jgi:hypothetical protein
MQENVDMAMSSVGPPRRISLFLVFNKIHKLKLELQLKKSSQERLVLKLPQLMTDD